MPLTPNWELLEKNKNFKKRLAKTKPDMAFLSGAFTGNDKTIIWQDFHFKYTSRFSK